MKDSEKLEGAIRDHVSGSPAKRTYDGVLNEVKSILDRLAESGELGQDDDKNLGGRALEIRTKMLFKEMGLGVVDGRAGLEDLVIQPSPELLPQKPVVVEVKSSKNPHISRRDLRQLDDWVFDLSGEEEARKRGLGGGFDPLSMFSHGMVSSRREHPSAHKGVMLFNGPAGSDFKDRPPTCFSENDLEFIETRDFCIVSFGVLLEYAGRISSDCSLQSVFWERVHRTVGMLEHPK